MGRPDEATGARVAAAFADVPLFARLGPRQREALASKATTRRYRAGQIVVRQGDTSMAFYVVLSGTLRIDRLTESGRRSTVMASLGEVGFFGEMGLIEDEPRSATVSVVEDAECALLAKWDFQHELRSDPDIALALLPVLLGRIRALDARLARDGAG